jgi:hypothetical protein
MATPILRQESKIWLVVLDIRLKLIKFEDYRSILPALRDMGNGQYNTR